MVVVHKSFDGPDEDGRCPTLAFVEWSENHKISRQVAYVRKVVALGAKVRGVKLRQPLSSARAFLTNHLLFNNPEFQKVLLDEWNVQRVDVFDVRCFARTPSLYLDCVVFDTTITPELESLGRERQSMREEIRKRQMEERTCERPK